MQTSIFGLCFFPSETKLVNVLVIETKWIIWKNRNGMKYNNKTSNCNVLLKCIMTNVNNQLYWKKDQCRHVPAILYVMYILMLVFVL